MEAPRHVAFAGRMGTSASRWGMELEPADDGQTDAMMWIEIDLTGIMQAVPGLLKGSLQRVSDREMVAIKAAVESGHEEVPLRGEAPHREEAQRARWSRACPLRRYRDRGAHREPDRHTAESA